MELDLTLLSLILAALLNFVLGGAVLAYTKGRRSNVFFGLFAFSLGIWTITILGFRLSTSTMLLFLWMKAAYISAIFIGLFFALFARIFPQEENIRSANYVFHFFVAIIFAVIIAATDFIVEEVRREPFGIAVTVGFIGWVVYACYFLGYFLTAHVYLLVKYLKTQGILRKQLIYIFLGVFLGGEVFGVFFNLILPSPFFNEWRYIWIGPTLTALIVVPTITYAIARYQLLNIKVITAQILVVITVILAFVDVFFYRNYTELVVRSFFFLLIAVFGFFLIKSVMTEVHRREQIETLNRELQKILGKLKDATHKLKLQNEELQKVDKMKSEFISIASHQLRTPLTATKWALEFLAKGKKGKLTKQEAETIGDLRASNARLIKLVNELLNVSRLEESRVRIDPKPTDVVTLLKGLVHEFLPIAEKMSQKIDEQYDALPLINLDESLIIKALHNFISNGIKYNKEKEKFTVIAKKKGKEALLTFQDHGIGIPKAEQPNIFKKFYRATNASASHTEGTGLGMYIAKTAIELSGGTVWFESVEGKGTTFYVTLPLSGSQAREGEKSLA